MSAKEVKATMVETECRFDLVDAVIESPGVFWTSFCIRRNPLHPLLLGQQRGWAAESRAGMSRSSPSAGTCWNHGEWCEPIVGAGSHGNRATERGRRRREGRLTFALCLSGCLPSAPPAADRAWVPQPSLAKPQ